jgi:subtilisin family serine protease
MMLPSARKPAIWIIAFVCLFVSLGWALADRSNQSPRKATYVPGELLVKYRASARRAALEDSQRQRGVSTLRTFESIRVRHLKLPEGMTVEQALKMYRDDPDVAYAEPNYYRYATATPDDTFFSRLWGLHNTGQQIKGTGGTPDADMDAPEAWDTQTGSSAVVVAVLDTGADWNHQDLSANIWNNDDEAENGADSDGNGYIDDIRGWDFVKMPDGDNDPDDDNDPSYHGTHVSGTIGAVGDNGIGVTGVNWSVSIMPLKILGADGSGSVANEVEAINYAVANGANIINASFTGGTYSPSERDAINSARAVGVLFVAAAGNDSQDNGDIPAYPASYDLDNVIAVAATDQTDDLAWFSNYGATSVDVAAPGVNIYSTKAGNTYQYMDGTSMATPHVAGLAGLIWAENAGFTYDQVKERILNGVDVLPALTGDILMAGRINANNSINPGSLPDAPSGLGVGALSTSEIALSWADNADDESGFKIERKTNLAGSYSHIVTVSANVDSYDDTGLSEGTTYYYRVLAFNAAGDSAPSEDNATTSLAAPSNLSAVAVSSSRIDLSWTDHSSVESGFRIEQKVGSGGTYTEIAVVGTDVEDYSSTGLDDATTYYYRVRAYKGAIDSVYSNETSAGTRAASSGSGGDTGVASAPAPAAPTNGGGGGGGGGCFISAAFHGPMVFPFMIVPGLIIAALVGLSRIY